MIAWWNRMIEYFAAHVMLNSIAHVAAGFGLAILLQNYLKGNSFLPAWVGWGLVAFSAAIHIMAYMG